MGMLVLLLVSTVYADHSNYASAPASDSFPFEDIKDPNAQCVDIKCFEPIKWNDNKKEVCRSTKARTCKPVQTEVNKSNQSLFCKAKLLTNSFCLYKPWKNLN